MNIVLKSVDDLIKYEKNARVHSSDQINQIAESIKNFGFNDPIEIGEDNILISGHARLEAAKKLGMKEVPTITHAHMTKTQRKGYVLAANRIAMSSTWDNDLLRLEFEELQGDDFDLLLTGFEQDEIDLLLNPEELNDGLVDADECGEVDEDNVVSVLGDVWLLGRHRLMCGDSTMIDSVESLMSGEKADLIFTDPPYNIASDASNFVGNSPSCKKGSKALKALSNAEWDKDFDIEPAIINAILVSKEACAYYVWSSHFLIGRIWKVLKEHCDFTHYLVWSKSNPMPSISKKHPTFSTELCAYATRGTNRTVNFPSAGNFLSCREHSKGYSDGSHPTMKPIDLIEPLINFSSGANHLVLDLFGGSGSTLIACEKLGRNCYMMEFSPEYCDVIIRRWEKFTGKKAIHADTGEEFNELRS